MKKTYKIALILLGAFALLVGAMALEGAFSSYSPEGKNQNSVFSSLTNSIQQQWREEGKWSRSLFDNQIHQISQYRKRGKLTDSNRYQLIEWVGISCNNVIDSIFNVQMAAPQSDESFIVANKKGLDFLRAYVDPRTEKKPFLDVIQIQKSLDMYKAYAAAFAFARKEFVASAIVKDDFTWTPFESIRAGWDLERTRIQNGEYFSSHFSHTNVVRVGWNQYGSKVEDAKRLFYGTLESNLKSLVTRRSSELTGAANDLISRGKSVLQTGGRISDLWPEEEQWISSVDEFVRAASEANTRLRSQAGSGSEICNRMSTEFNGIAPKAALWKENVRNTLHP